MWEERGMLPSSNCITPIAQKKMTFSTLLTSHHVLLLVFCTTLYYVSVRLVSAIHQGESQKTNVQMCQRIKIHLDYKNFHSAVERKRWCGILHSVRPQIINNLCQMLLCHSVTCLPEPLPTCAPSDVCSCKLARVMTPDSQMGNVALWAAHTKNLTTSTCGAKEMKISPFASGKTSTRWFKHNQMFQNDCRPSVFTFCTFWKHRFRF